MTRQFFKYTFLIIAFFIANPFTAAHAESINGGWLGDNGDLIFMVKSSKGQVMALDVTADKKLRYVFTGTMTGNVLNLKTPDGATTFDATVSSNTLTGVITPTSSAAQNLTAKLYMAYAGSTYDGIWKTDGVEDYFMYASLTIKGSPNVMVPYFSFHSDKTVTFNLFMGSPASADSNGNLSYAGISILDYSALKLAFTSTSIANATLVKDFNKPIKFTINKVYGVTKKSGEF
ncbi:hypothetical protein JCM14076_23120 [Methylosoma difficile]